MEKEQIVHYYETCESDYRLFWDLKHSLAMHAGYWDEHTHSLRDALRRENEILAEIAGIKKGEYVLDAGCGVGGSAIFLAKTLECHVVGITLSAKQVSTAAQNAAQAGVQERTTFYAMDFTHTEFSSGTFDVVWGLESICHTGDKKLFIKEAARLLKPDGRLIVADGFAQQIVYSKKDQHKMGYWLKGWGVEQLESAEVFAACLKNEGFEDIHFRDITVHVIPSSRRLYGISWFAIPLSKIGEWLSLRSPSQTANLYSARYQYQTMKKGLWHYGIFYARK